MALDEETRGKLAIALAGEIDLFDKVIHSEQESESRITSIQSELDETKQKSTEVDQRNTQLANMVTSLIAKVPIGETKTQHSQEQQLNDIMNRKWEK